MQLIIQSSDNFLDTIKAENVCYYKRFLEDILPPASSAPHVDRVDVETDEDVDENFENFSDRDMEDEYIVSSEDILKYYDAIVNRWLNTKSIPVM